MHKEEHTQPQQLSYDKMLHSLNFGKAFYLPEWEGFWFQYKKVMVFTKGNEFLDTPQHLKYQDRNDWMEVNFGKNTLIRFVKGMRVSIDHMRTMVKTYLKNNREVSFVSTELQLASMWLGYLLAEIGEPTPYPQSSNAASPIIEKHADRAAEFQRTEMLDAMNGHEDIGKTKYMRNQIDIYNESLTWVLAYVVNPGKVLLQSINPHLGICAAPTAVIHLMNAKLWLGQELNNIRERQDADVQFKDLG